MPVHRFMVFMRRWGDVGVPKEGKRAAKGASEARVASRSQNELVSGHIWPQNASRKGRPGETMELQAIFPAPEAAAGDRAFSCGSTGCGDRRGAWMPGIYQGRLGSQRRVDLLEHIRR